MVKLSERVAQLEKELAELKEDFAMLVHAHGISQSDRKRAYDLLRNKY